MVVATRPRVTAGFRCPSADLANGLGHRDTRRLVINPYKESQPCTK